MVHGDAVAQAPLVWLRSFAPVLAPVREDERRRHADHLAAIVADPESHRRDPALGYPDDSSPAPPIDGALCSHCRGRCCRHGAGRNAFVDAELLRRHVSQHGGSLAAAATHYVERIPDRHVEGSCVYHGEHGCALPRAERAPVCNGFACDSLREARSWSGRSGVAGLLVVERGADADSDDVDGAAWLSTPAGPTQAVVGALAAASTERTRFPVARGHRGSARRSGGPG